MPFLESLSDLILGSQKVTLKVLVKDFGCLEIDHLENGSQNGAKLDLGSAHTAPRLRLRILSQLLGQSSLSGELRGINTAWHSAWPMAVKISLQAKKRGLLRLLIMEEKWLEHVDKTRSHMEPLGGLLRPIRGTQLRSGPLGTPELPTPPRSLGRCHPRRRRAVPRGKESVRSGGTLPERCDELDELCMPFFFGTKPEE